jgi:hypothetical protein
MNLLRAFVPAAEIQTFIYNMAVYYSPGATTAMRAAAYQMMWRLVAGGIRGSAVSMLARFVAPALTAAGAGASMIAEALTAIGAAALGVLSSPYTLIFLAALALLIMLWLFLDWLNQRAAARSRQQNIELEQSTKKLFGGNARPLPYYVLVNNPMYGPMQPICTKQLQPGCVGVG